MNREDCNLISSILLTAIKEGEAEPKLVLRFAARLSQHIGPAFSSQEFVNRCVPPKQKVETGKIQARPLPPEQKKEAVLIEDNAALFSAIMAIEFPMLAGRVCCALTLSQQARFTIGRVGGKVWIRFGKQAMLDPVAAVRAAAPDAEMMAQGHSTAERIVGR